MIQNDIIQKYYKPVESRIYDGYKVKSEYKVCLLIKTRCHVKKMAGKYYKVGIIINGQESV